MAFRRIDKTRYQAHKTVGSVEEIQHAVNTDATLDRPRCIRIGPHADINHWVESAPAGFQARWQRVNGFDADLPLRFEGGSGFLKFEDSRVMTYLNLIPFQIVTSSASEDLSKTFCEWEFEVEIKRFDSSTGVWNQIGISSTRQTFAHNLTAMKSGFPVLLQELYRWQIDDLTGDPGYAYREGQLFQNDLALIRRVSIQTDVEHDDRVPVEIILRVERITPEADIEFHEDSDDLTGVSKLFLMNVGSSIWEVPQ